MMMVSQVTYSPDWLTAWGTVAACVVALVIALFGKGMGRLFYHPDLDLRAVVRNPDSQKVLRWRREANGSATPLGEAWFFRLEVWNSGRAPAREVQAYLARVEKLDGTRVERFSPMNLKWTHTTETTRKVLLREVPVFCDFIHVGDPAFRALSGEDLETVAPGRAVLALDVEVASSARAHLLEPGGYRFHLRLAAENSPTLYYTVEVRYDGTWFLDQGQMFDREVGFRMEKV